MRRASVSPTNLGEPGKDGSAHASSRASRGSSPVPSQVEALEGMDRNALLALWSEVLGGEPASRLSQPFLRRVLAWELQAKEQGGLAPAVVRQLASFSAGQANGKETSPASPRLRPGGRLLREWNGVTHVVDVVEGGFLWRGERHRSLSAIARAITGAHWSGPRFFGLQECGSAAAAGLKKQAPSARRAKAEAKTSPRTSRTVA